MYFACCEYHGKTRFIAAVVGSVIKIKWQKCRTEVEGVQFFLYFVCIVNVLIFVPSPPTTIFPNSSYPKGKILGALFSDCFVLRWSRETLEKIPHYLCMLAWICRLVSMQTLNVTRTFQFVSWTRLYSHDVALAHRCCLCNAM